MIKKFKVVSGRPIEGRTFDLGEVIDLPTQVASYYLAIGVIIHDDGSGNETAKPEARKDADAPPASKPRASKKKVADGD